MQTHPSLLGEVRCSTHRKARLDTLSLEQHLCLVLGALELPLALGVASVRLGLAVLQGALRALKRELGLVQFARCLLSMTGRSSHHRDSSTL